MIIIELVQVLTMKELGTIQLPAVPRKDEHIIVGRAEYKVGNVVFRVNENVLLYVKLIN